MFRRKYSITIIDENWVRLVDNTDLRFLPRKDEFIFIESFGKYFKVLNVIHYLTKKQGIFLVVKPINDEIALKSENLKINK